MSLKAVVSAILIAALLPRATSAAEKNLRFTMQRALDDPAGQNIAKFKEDIEAATAKSLGIVLFDGGQLYPDYQVPAAVGGGTIEMGVTPLAQYAQFIPVTGVFMQPFMFNFPAIVQAAAKRGGAIRQLIDDAVLAETGSRVLWWQPDGWNVIFSKYSAIRPKAIAGQNVRVFDEVSSQFVTLCGGNAQLISESKQAEALDLNLVDATVTSAESVKGYALWKRTRYLSDIRHSANILIAVINDDVWRKLSETQKSAISAAADAAERRSWQEFNSVENETYALARARSMIVEEPSPDDLVAWRICSSPILEDFVERAGEAGQELLGAYGKLRTDPCCSQTLQAGVSQ